MLFSVSLASIGLKLSTALFNTKNDGIDVVLVTLNGIMSLIQ